MQLLAVSKNRTAAELAAAAACGQRCFGESYLQEALAKQTALADADLEWHFIGPIQSNKTRQIAEHFDWVHSIDRLKIAERLNAQRPEQLPPLNVCLQVKLSAEPSKSGASIDNLTALAAAVQGLSRLRLRGLMALPAAVVDFERQRQPFRQLYALYSTLNSNGYQLDTLSMGMSNDLEAAIAEGSTLVRIGTAIFGPRSNPST